MQTIFDWKQSTKKVISIRFESIIYAVLMYFEFKRLRYGIECCCKSNTKIAESRVCVCGLLRVSHKASDAWLNIYIQLEYLLSHLLLFSLSTSLNILLFKLINVYQSELIRNVITIKTISHWVETRWSKRAWVTLRERGRQSWQQRKKKENQFKLNIIWIWQYISTIGCSLPIVITTILRSPAVVL